MSNALQDESWFVWQDKSVNITIYEDAQVMVQGDVSRPEPTPKSRLKPDPKL